jgi:hypothetical protein
MSKYNLENSDEDSRYVAFLRVICNELVCILCCQLVSVNPKTGKFSLPVPVKSTGVQLILVLSQDEKS